MKLDKMLYIVYSHLKSLIKKIISNPEKSSTTIRGVHILCVYSVSIIRVFESTENKYIYIVGKSAW